MEVWCGMWILHGGVSKRKTNNTSKVILVKVTSTWSVYRLKVLWIFVFSPGMFTKQDDDQQRLLLKRVTTQNVYEGKSSQGM